MEQAFERLLDGEMDRHGTWKLYLRGFLGFSTLWRFFEVDVVEVPAHFRQQEA